MSNRHTILESIKKADLVISSILIRGAKSPQIITAEMIKMMKPGAVIVDVAIDQGGSCETSRPTTHENPVYLVDDVVHYCVTNMPGAVARTSTYALTNATLPYIVLLAKHDCREVIKQSYPMSRAVNMIHGKLVIKEVAEAFNLTLNNIND